MAKKTKKSIKTIDELHESRNGGQIALQGYSYQFLYSCYLIASSDDDRTSFQLEGMEDIDRIEYNVDGTSLLHIQLKYSTQRQDASFMKSVLKNFLEVYLLDQNRNFKLVYDFDVATGHLSKLIAGKLDATSVEHWQNVIAEIEQAAAHWDWSKYSFDDFISKLSFEKVARSDLEQHILDVLAANYQITTDNVQLFANALKFLCFETMVKRGSLTNADGIYIEGLHPVRSRHIVDILHKFFPLEDTAFSVVTLVRQEDVARFFSHFPEHDINTPSFYHRLVEHLWDQHNIDWFIPVMQGLFSGSIMQYYQTNKEMFDDASQCGGLFILSTDLCPFAKFDEFDVSIDTLDRLHEMQPQNQNINHLIALREKMPMCDFHATPVLIFCTELYAKCSMYRNDQIPDIISYLAVAEWLYNLDPALSLSNNLPLEYIWDHSDCLPIDTLATAMYLSYCSQRETYLSFVNQNMDMVLLVLKHHTESQRVFINQERNAIHVEYFLRLSEIKKANDESVARLKVICKTLPIFDLYCSDAIKPSLDILEKYTVPDEAHKEMSKRDVVIMFRQNMTSLWNATIESNYEYDTVGEWLEHWLQARELICSLADAVCACIYRLLEGKNLGTHAAQFASLHNEYNRLCITEALYPRQKRPFETEPLIPKGFASIKRDYFSSLNVLWGMVVDFLKRVDRIQNLLIVNLRKTQGTLEQLQSFFLHLVDHTEYYDRHVALVQKEERALSNLEMCCRYYIEHQPNKYFGKYSIKTWYQKWYEKRMNDARETLSELESIFNAVFPVKAYYSGNLQYYPIILKDIDTTDENAMGKLWLYSIPFADADFDYLVIAFSEKESFVNRMCLQFPAPMLKEIKQAIEDEDSDRLESVSYPYPADATETMLECFDHIYRILPLTQTDPQATTVGDIAEELWIYSKLNTFLLENDDKEYYKDQQMIIWDSIKEHQKQLLNVLTHEKSAALDSIIEGVHKGEPFDNPELNNFVTDFSIETA